MKRLRFKVAATLGCTVGELRRRMTRAELTEWAAYFLIEEEERARDLG